MIQIRVKHIIGLIVILASSVLQNVLMTAIEVKKGFGSLSWQYFVFVIGLALGSWIMCFPTWHRQERRKKAVTETYYELGRIRK